MGKAAGSGAEVLSAAALIGIPVVSAPGEEDLGRIEELMIDLESGQVGYAILAVGGNLGMGDKLLAIPWKLLQLDSEQMRFHFTVEAEKLRQAPGFDKNSWPRMGDRQWGLEIHRYYGQPPYWEESDRDIPLGWRTVESYDVNRSQTDNPGGSQAESAGRARPCRRFAVMPLPPARRWPRRQEGSADGA